MLVLSRKENEVIHVGDGIKITLVECRKGYARIGIDAPANLPIVREELLQTPNPEEKDDGS